jgi:hypothetical protein
MIQPLLLFLEPNLNLDYLTATNVSSSKPLFGVIGPGFSTCCKKKKIVRT